MGRPLSFDDRFCCQNPTKHGRRRRSGKVAGYVNRLKLAANLRQSGEFCLKLTSAAPQ
jgi:hypothetical protein